MQRTQAATQRHEQLDAALLREIAVESQTDPRSVRKEYERPGSVRGMPGRRIRTAFGARGITGAEVRAA